MMLNVAEVEVKAIFDEVIRSRSVSERSRDQFFYFTGAKVGKVRELSRDFAPNRGRPAKLFQKVFTYPRYLPDDSPRRLRVSAETHDGKRTNNFIW